MKLVQYPVRMLDQGIELVVYVKVLVPNYLVKQYGPIEAVKMYHKVK